MTIAVGAPLDEVFGQGYTKKKNKKKKGQETTNHVSRQEMQKMVHNFDENFHPITFKSFIGKGIVLYC